ncbi:hypothetical protein ACFCX4_05005, partial [Kitasatospora sp. NPDC056327]
MHRITGIPERDGVPQADRPEWARRHHEDTRHILNHEARVRRWTAAADGLNMALIDAARSSRRSPGGPAGSRTASASRTGPSRAAPPPAPTGRGAPRRASPTTSPTSGPNAGRTIAEVAALALTDLDGVLA